MKGAAAPTRLRQPGGRLEAAPARVGPHNARRLAGAVLLTGEGGGHAWVSEAEYARFLSGVFDDESALGAALRGAGVVRDRLDLLGLAERAVSRHLLDHKGPGVHTAVLTRRCNVRCLYCHASVVAPDAADADMTVETARRVVDLVFASPSPSLMIEFQGGEPLLNWPALRFIVRYAKAKNRLHKRALHFGLISNFTLLDEERLDWLAGEGVSFCTSLDGPEALHNKNRIYLGGNGHADAVAGLRRIQARRAAGAALDAPNAICTVTRFSLPHARAIVDQLIELGIERVQLGPLDPIGFARRSWATIGTTPAEFVRFYGEALDYIIERSAAGAKVYEKMALIFLIRILEGAQWRFPNADGLARLAYDFDGSVYSCEEGRLLAAEGDRFFRLGHVAETGYEELLEHPTVRASALAAAPFAQPQCFQCVYNPYCTILPVYNYQTQGSVWGQMPSNGWCEKMMGIFDALFLRLKDPAKRRVLESWLEHKQR